MPPKKKKHWFRNQDDKPGIGKQHLLNVFSQLPADCNSILNGHVLYLYIVKCEKGRAATTRELATFIDQSSMDVQQRKKLLIYLNTEIMKLLTKTLSKFKSLTSKQLQQFDSICQRTFPLTPPPVIKVEEPDFPNAPEPDEKLTITVQQPNTSSSLDGAQPLTDILVSVQPSPEDVPVQPSSVDVLVQPSSVDVPVQPSSVDVPVHPLKTRRSSKCNICKTRRENMIVMRKKMLQLQKALKTAEANNIVRARKGNTVSVKRLNQKIKRKEEQLLKAKKKLEESPMMIALKAAHNNIRSLEKRNRKMKLYYKKKKALSRADDKESNALKKRNKKIKHCSKNKKALSHSSVKADDDIDGEKEEINILEKPNKRFKRCSKNKNAFSRSSVNADDDSMVEEIDGEKEECAFEDTVQEMNDSFIGTKSDQKSYSPNMRLMVFDAIVSQVPTSYVPKLIANFARRCNLTLKNIPHRSTVELMARELGVISDFQAAEALISSKDSTLAFNATTKENVHVNEIHVTTEKDCYSIALDELPGGMAADYATHITDSIDNLADVYSFFNSENFLETKVKLVDNITNSPADRCTLNRAAMKLVNEAWGKCLNELNCNLHPQDPISTKVRSALNKFEKDHQSPKKDLGSDSLAQLHIIDSEQMMGMFSAAQRKAPTATLCYISSKLRAQKNRTINYLDSLDGDKRENIIKKAMYFSKKQWKRRKSGQKDLMVELPNGQADEQQADEQQADEQQADEQQTDEQQTDEQQTDEEQTDEQQIDEQQTDEQQTDEQQTDEEQTDEEQTDEEQTDEKQTDEKQTDEQQTDEQQIDEEQIDEEQTDEKQTDEKQTDEKQTDEKQTDEKQANKQQADKQQADKQQADKQQADKQQADKQQADKQQANKQQANKQQANKQQANKQQANKQQANKQQANKQQANKQQANKQQANKQQANKQQANKQQARDITERKMLEEKLKSISVDQIPNEFPLLNEDKLADLIELLNGKAIGREIVHLWYEEGEDVTYKGKLKTVFGSGKQKKYEVAYWEESGTFDDAIDYKMSIFALAADLIVDDLIM